MSLLAKAMAWLADRYEFTNGSFVRRLLTPASDSGEVITPETSLRQVIVLRCALLVAGALASLPIDVYQKSGGRRINVDTHPIARIFNREPNPEMDAMSFRVMLGLSFLLWGNADCYKVMRGEEPIALWPMLPQFTEITRRESNNELVWVYRGKEPKVFAQSQVLHVPFFPLNGVHGMSIIEQAENAIGMHRTTEKFSSKFLRNGARPSVVVKHPARLTEAAYSHLKQTINEQYSGSENAGRPWIAEEGMDVSVLSVNPRDSQLLEQRQLNDEQIAMLFGVPPHMVGLVTKTTSWGTGVAEQKQGFLDFTLAPLAMFFERAIEKYMLTHREKLQGFYVKHNLNAWLRADIQTRMNSYVSAVSNGLFNRNECRAFEDMDPYEGGDLFTIQQQNIPVQMAGDHLKDGGANATQRPA